MATVQHCDQYNLMLVQMVHITQKYQMYVLTLMWVSVTDDTYTCNDRISETLMPTWICAADGERAEQ